MILVTGGCGFIGSAFVLDWLAASGEPLVNLDALTYAGHPGNLAEVEGQPGYTFVHGDIGDLALVQSLLQQHRPRAVVHLAAETHVDRSIAGPETFVHSNVLGSVRLLQACLSYWQALPPAEASAFRFLNVSTDEVFGALAPRDAAFTEQHPYRPNSPYAASKAAADHFVRSWWHTYRFPALTTHCSNNYGPRQFPEKLIPLMLHNALEGKPLPVYGDGLQVRDWLHVQDHCAALRAVLERGQPGESYAIGGSCERTNLDVVLTLCAVLDELRPQARPHARLIEHVPDRPGHDRRYAIDSNKVRHHAGWRPKISFDQGLRSTVEWYLAHREWVRSVTSGSYRDWIQRQYPGLEARA